MTTEADTTQTAAQRAEAQGDPLRLAYESAFAPQIDLENRILDRVVVATRRLASDGWIIPPYGLDLTRYDENRIVTADHDPETGTLGPVIARAVSIGTESLGLVATVQFADTERGREYAYLYGVNPKKETYMRSWSIDGSILQRSTLSWEQARTWLGSLWDQNMADLVRARGATSVRMADRFLVRSFAATAVGADRGALTRAANEGCRLAVELGGQIDLDEARRTVEALRADDTGKAATQELLRQIKALARDVAEAAHRGDTSALLEEIRNLSVKAKT